MKRLICFVLSICLIISSLFVVNTNVLAESNIQIEKEAERTYLKPTSSSGTVDSWGSSTKKDDTAFVFQISLNEVGLNNKAYLFVVKPASYAGTLNFNNIKGTSTLHKMTSPYKCLNLPNSEYSLETCAARIADNDSSFNNGGVYYYQSYKGSVEGLVAFLFIPKSYLDGANAILDNTYNNLRYFPSNATSVGFYDNDIQALENQRNILMTGDKKYSISINYPKYKYVGKNKYDISGSNSNGGCQWGIFGSYPTTTSAYARKMMEFSFSGLSYENIYIDMTFEYGNFYGLKTTVNAPCNDYNSATAACYYNWNDYSEKNTNTIDKKNKTVTILRNKNNHSTTYDYEYTKVDVNQHNKITKCKNCKAVLRIDKENHNYNINKITKEPTCTEDGIRTYTCANCGQTRNEIINRLGHISDNNYVTKKAPTCTEKGIAVTHCARCKVEMETKELNALGHDYKEITENATYTKEGHVKKVCSRCNDTQIIKTIPKLTKTETPTTDKNNNTKDDKDTATTSSTTIDKNGKINGKDSSEFTQDGIKYKVQVNPDKSVSVYYYDTSTKSWKLVPNNDNGKSDYTYTTINNNNGTKTIVIKPTKVGKVKITSFMSPKKKKAIVTYQSAKNAKKYQIQISTNKKFKKNVKKYTSKKTIYKFKNLKSKKTYYVRVRGYKVLKNGKKVYGSWSKTKKLKVK